MKAGKCIWLFLWTVSSRVTQMSPGSENMGHVQPPSRVFTHHWRTKCCNTGATSSVHTRPSRPIVIAVTHINEKHQLNSTNEVSHQSAYDQCARYVCVSIELSNQTVLSLPSSHNQLMTVLFSFNMLQVTMLWRAIYKSILYINLYFI